MSKGAVSEMCCKHSAYHRNYLSDFMLHLLLQRRKHIPAASGTESTHDTGELLDQRLKSSCISVSNGLESNEVKHPHLSVRSKKRL